jgi:hypothetical protein
MPSPIEPSLFDFVDEFATEITKNHPGPFETLAANSRIITFCESFFVQLFANVFSTTIEGFDTEAKRLAAGFAVDLEEDDTAAPLRALLSLFESFCAMYEDLMGGMSGGSEITYVELHSQYISLLLERAKDWAQAEEHQDLAERASQAQRSYEQAAKSQSW